MSGNLTEYVDNLKKNATKPELAFKTYLEKTYPKLKFEFQFPISPYIVDFYIPALRLIIELDGSSHDNKELYDQNRDKYLEENNFNIIHARNHVAENHPENIMETVHYVAKQLLTEKQRAISSYIQDIEKYRQKLSNAELSARITQDSIDILTVFLGVIE